MGWAGTAFDITKSVGSALVRTDAGRAFLGSSAIGVGTWAATGSFGAGHNAFTGSFGGASLGFASKGRMGMIAGGLLGAAGQLGMYEGGKALGGGFGGAFVGGVGTSVAASLGVAATMKGGFLHRPMLKGIRGLAKFSGKKAYNEELARLSTYSPEMRAKLGKPNLNKYIGRAYKKTWDDLAAFGVNPKGGAGFAGNMTDITGAGSEGFKRWTGKHKTSTRLINATFGSPGLIREANKYGSLAKAPSRAIAKAVAQDVVEGAPFGIATGAISLGFGALFGSANKDNTTVSANKGYNKV